MATAVAAPATQASPSESPGRPSQDRPWQIASFAEDAGILQQRVFDIAFDLDGAVWVAASDGLHRFDGYGWTRYGVSSGLPSNFVRAVLVTRKGELWVGSDAGAGVYDFRTGRYERRGSEKGLAGKNIRQIVEDDEGTIWFSCDLWPETSDKKGGLSWLRDGHWGSNLVEDGLPLNYVLGYYRSPDGRQFAFTPHGWVQRQGDQWKPPQDAGYDQEPCVLSMTAGPDGSLFALGETQSLVLSNHTWTPLKTGIRLMCTTSQGEVLAVEQQGAGGFCFSRWNGTGFERVSAPFQHPGTDARLYKAAQAPDGSVWVVGFGLLVRWEYLPGQWSFYPNLPPPFTQDRRGRIWFAEGDKTVVRNSGHFETVSEIKRLLTVDNDGMGWGVSAADSSLVRVAPDSRQSLRHESVDMPLLREAQTDASGKVWVVGLRKNGSTGVYCFDGRKGEMLDSPELQNKTIQAISVDPEKGIWAVLRPEGKVDYQVAHITSEGVELQPTTNQPRLTYPNYLVAGGRHWIYGYQGVYQRMPGEDKTWETVASLPAFGFLGALSHANEVFFLFSSSQPGQSGCRLFTDGRWLKHEGAFYNLYQAHDDRTVFLTACNGFYIRRQPGTLDLDFVPLPEEGSIEKVLQDSDGCIWLGTSKGVYLYHPGLSPPKASIHASALEMREGGRLPVTFHSTKRFVRAVTQESFLFSWRVDGGAWTSFQKWTSDALSLPGLVPGNHVLELKSRDGDGNEDRLPARIQFSVSPTPLQERAWFLPTVGLVFVVMTGLVWLSINRNREIARRNKELSAEVAVRIKTQAELLQIQDTLEHRVTERTESLYWANESLYREIQEHRESEENRRRLQEQLWQAQKMEAVGTLAGGVAHDFNNILAAIIPFTELALRETKEQHKVQVYLGRVMTAAERATELVRQILVFGRRQASRREIVQLHLIVEETVRMVRPAFPANIEIVQNFQEGLPPVSADSTQLHQVLLNLCTNAQHAISTMKRPGLLEITLGLAHIAEPRASTDPVLAAGDYVKLSVRDNGCGMSAEVQHRIFEPFFTTKPVGQSTGLGLAVVHGIIQEHNGAVTMSSRLGIGTELSVYLPACQNGETPGEPPEETIIPGCGETVMVVDDEQPVCEAACSVLKQLGYQVVSFWNPVDALEAFESDPAGIDLLMTDLNMPNMTGMELAERMLHKRSELPILISTGFGAMTSPESLARLGRCRIVAKPYRAKTISREIHQILHPPGLSG